MKNVCVCIKEVDLATLPADEVCAVKCITVCNFLLNDVGSNKRKVVIVAVVVPIAVLLCAMVAGLLLVTQRKRAGKKTMI